MRGIYIASTRANAGKAFFSSAFSVLLQRRGLSVGFMKPLGSRLKRVEAGNGDEAALIIQELIGQDAVPDDLSPVLLPQAWSAAGLPQPSLDAALALDRIVAAYGRISAGRDMMVVSGTGNFPSAGSLYGLDGLTVARALGVKTILLDRFDDGLDLDGIIFRKGYLGDDLLGVVLNDVPQRALSLVQKESVPLLESRGIPVLAVIPREHSLNVIRCLQLAYELKGRIVAGNSSSGRNITNFLIGTMQLDGVMMHLRCRKNCAVVVGGDRPDLQFAAMYGNCACLVLTGNVGPNELVRAKAESTDTPVIVVKEDSFAVARQMNRILKMQAFLDLQQISAGIDLLEASADLPRLLDAVNGKAVLP